MEHSWKYKTFGGFDDLVMCGDGSLTGYGGGLNNKVSLLAHEGAEISG